MGKLVFLVLRSIDITPVIVCDLQLSDLSLLPDILGLPDIVLSLILADSKQ